MHFDRLSVNYLSAQKRENENENENENGKNETFLTLASSLTTLTSSLTFSLVSPDTELVEVSKGYFSLATSSTSSPKYRANCCMASANAVFEVARL
jgi:hypothetical protein